MAFREFRRRPRDGLEGYAEIVVLGEPQTAGEEGGQSDQEAGPACEAPKLRGGDATPSRPPSRAARVHSVPNEPETFRPHTNHHMG